MGVGIEACEIDMRRREGEKMNAAGTLHSTHSSITMTYTPSCSFSTMVRRHPCHQSRPCRSAHAWRLAARSPCASERAVRRPRCPTRRPTSVSTRMIAEKKVTRMDARILVARWFTSRSVVASVNKKISIAPWRAACRRQTQTPPILSAQ